MRYRVSYSGPHVKESVGGLLKEHIIIALSGATDGLNYCPLEVGAATC